MPKGPSRFDEQHIRVSKWEWVVTEKDHIDFESGPSQLTAAVVQMTSSNSVAHNQEQILSALGLIEQPVDLVCFPENCWFMKLNESDELPDFAKANEFQSRLQIEADRLNAAIVLGTVPMRGEGDLRPYASSWVVEPGGTKRELYRKIHLFDVDVVGAKPVRESDSLRPGSEPTVWSFRGFCFGCAICYDVRFSNLFFDYALAGCDVLMLPSAFLVPTGRSHWETLLRARAIESQCYLLAAAQSGEHEARSQAEERFGRNAALATEPVRNESTARRTYGRSVVVDPWGRVVAAAAAEKSGVEILRWTLEKSEIGRVRAQIPMSQHRKKWAGVRSIGTRLGMVLALSVLNWGVIQGEAIARPIEPKRVDARGASQQGTADYEASVERRARMSAELGRYEDELKVRSELSAVPRTVEPLPSDLRVLEAGGEVPNDTSEN